MPRLIGGRDEAGSGSCFHHLHAGVLPREFFHQGISPVSGAVIDQNELEIRQCLRKTTLNSHANRRLRIAGWHDDRDRQVWFGTGQKVQICVASIQQGLIDESTPQSSVRAHSLNPRENVVAN